VSANDDTTTDRPRLGVCWYPEQWPEERWATDATMMADLGLDLVRIGEFAWSWYEPARDRWRLDRLDRAIDTLAAAGLSVVLGTPTAAPPVWLVRERPDVLAVGPDGRPRAYGSRRHVSPSSPAYRQESRRVVEVLAERYGEHPAVVAWQLDNEPGNHDSARCWSDAAQAAFTAWLEARYGSIEALNDAWGAAFWSGTYPSFDAVRLPVPTVTDHNPALELAHLRFAADQAREALAEQLAVVAAAAPGRATFTNLYLGDVDVEGQAIGRLHRLGAIDLYPHGVAGPQDVAFLLDHARGTALPAGASPADRGGRAWIVELQPGPVNWTGDNPAVPAGQVRLWAWQAVLHGIEAVVWFRWRAGRAGPEQHHAALLRHDATPDRAHTEVARVARELAAAAPGLLRRPAARVALLYRELDAWLLQIVPHVPGASHRVLLTAAHAAARRLGLDVDVVAVDADLAAYDLVLAPALHVVDAPVVERLRAATDRATVVVGPRALVRDEHGRWVDQPLPGGLATDLGRRVDQAGNPAGWPRGWAAPSRVRIGSEVVDAGPWLETTVPLVAADDGEVLDRAVGGSLDAASDGEVLANAVGGPLDGEVVASRRGRLVHLGASSVAAWTAVLAQLTGLEPVADHLEVLARGGTRVVLDHRAVTITGLGPDVDGATGA
jgi:beta-galactosidase